MLRPARSAREYSAAAPAAAPGWRLSLITPPAAPARRARLQARGRHGRRGRGRRWRRGGRDLRLAGGGLVALGGLGKVLVVRP